MNKTVKLITSFICFLSLFFVAPDSRGATVAKGVDSKEWKELVTRAQKEGTVSVYSAFVPAGARSAVQQAFKKKFDINVEYTPGTGAEIEQKFKTEYATGLRLTDLFHVGSIEFRDFIKPMKVSVPLEPLLMLPDVVEPAKWKGGRLPFLDAEKHALTLILLVDNFYAINTDLVKMDEIKSTLDVLNPKWKGKIVLVDPSVPGNSNEWFAHTILKVLGRERGEKFMRDLLKQEPTVVRDSRQAAEWVARGKHPLVIGASVSQPVDFIKNKAPIAFARLNEPNFITAAAGIFVTFKEAPHPNAAKLFINWLASREGSSIYAPAHGYPSVRTDVSTEGFVPAIIPGPNDRLSDTEEYMAEKAKLMKLAVEIFGGAR